MTAMMENTPTATPMMVSHDRSLLMAILEHERWMDAKLKDGWKFALQTSKEKKLHALLVDWERLPKDAKDKYIALVSENIPRLLKEAGYTIVKLSN